MAVQALGVGKKGEWLQMDLGGKKTVRAVQVNFADHNATVRAPQPPLIYKYIIEGSADGKKWTTLVDASANTDDAPHRLHVLPKAAKTRYLRITNMGDVDGCFSLYDLRVFGKGTGKKPARVTGFKAEREPGKDRLFVTDLSKSVDGVPVLRNVSCISTSLCGLESMTMACLSPCSP